MKSRVSICARLLGIPEFSNSTLWNLARLTVLQAPWASIGGWNDVYATPVLHLELHFKQSFGVVVLKWRNSVRNNRVFETFLKCWQIHLPSQIQWFFVVWCRLKGRSFGKRAVVLLHDQKIAMIKANNDPISKGWRCSGTCFPDATWTTIETNLLGVSNLRDAAMHFIWFDQDMGTLVQSGLNFTSQNRRNSWSLHHFPPFFYPLVRSISTQNKTLFGCFNGHAASVIPFPTSVLA